MVLQLDIQQETKRITIKKIFDALAENGVHHIRGEWFAWSGKGQVIGACAIGQAARNLNVPASENEDANNLWEALNQFEAPDKWCTPTAHYCGDVIVEWNDAPVRDRYGQTQYTAQGHTKFKLRTWNQVVNMAREVLEPHFDKTIELPYYEY